MKTLSEVKKEALELAAMLNKVNRLKIARSTMIKRIADWSKKYVTVETLAALALSIDYNENITDGDVTLIEVFWFPDVPYEFTEDSIDLLHDSEL